MSRRSQKIIQGLTPEFRELLAEALNQATFDELASIKGLGPYMLAGLLGAEVYDTPLGPPPTWPPTMGWVKSRWQLDGRERRHFRSDGKDIIFRERSEYIHELHDLVNYPVLLNLLQHFGIQDIQELNEVLTELRDIKTRLEKLVHVNNPIVVDYLRSIKAQLGRVP